MKIRELKAELAAHGICALNILEKSELVLAVNEAREGAAAKRQKKRGDHHPRHHHHQEVSSPSSSRKQDEPPHICAYARGNVDHPEEQRSKNDEIASMSVKQLKMELEKCGISPSQFFEKGEMQDALRSAQSINRNEHMSHQHSAGDVAAPTNPSRNSNTAPPTSVFPASLSESFGGPQVSARTTTHGISASTPSDSHPKKPGRSAKVSDQYSWCSSKEASRDVKSSTSRRSARRHSREETGQPASCCDTYAGSQDGGMKRMPQSFMPVNTFDSGTAGGEPMGGSPGAGLGSSVGGDAVFSDSPTDGNIGAANETVTETPFVPVSFKKAPVHHNSQRMGRDGGRDGMKRREYARAPAQASAHQSPSSVANNSFEQCFMFVIVELFDL